MSRLALCVWAINKHFVVCLCNKNAIPIKCPRPWGGHVFCHRIDQLRQLGVLNEMDFQGHFDGRSIQ